MNITNEQVKILQINRQSYPVVSDIVNWGGYQVTIPAFSLLFLEKFDREGHPIYETVNLQYVKTEDLEEGGVIELEASSKLEEIIEESENKPLTKYKSTDEQPQPRVVHGVQFFRNRITGQPYFCDEKFFISSLQRTKWDAGVGLHDQDFYLEKEVNAHLQNLRKQYQKSAVQGEGGLEAYIAEHQTIFLGNQKPPHIHIVFAGDRQKDGKRRPMRISTICKRLQLPEHCFKYVFDNSKRNGDDGFLDNILYIPHRSNEAVEEGKTEYDDELFWFSFDYKEALREREESLQKYGCKSLGLLEKWTHDVMFEGKKLKECEEEDWLLFSKHMKKLKELRSYYLREYAPIPFPKFTFYIEAVNAVGGEGKSLCTRSLAKVLAHQKYGAPINVPFDKLSDYIYVIGDSKVAVQHYDGQPIVIFNDFKAGDLLSAFKSRRMVKEFLEMFQETKISTDVKFGDVCLLPEFVIINGITSYEDFIYELSTAKSDRNEEDMQEDKAPFQYHRRIFSRLIIDLNDELLYTLMNLDILEPSAERKGFQTISRIRTNFREMKKNLEIGTMYELEDSHFNKLLSNVDLFIDNQAQKKNYISDEMLFYGREIPIPEDYSTIEEALEAYQNFNPEYKLGAPIYLPDLPDSSEEENSVKNTLCKTFEYTEFPLSQKKTDFLADYFGDIFCHLYSTKTIHPVYNECPEYPEELYYEAEENHKEYIQQTEAEAKLIDSYLRFYEKKYPKGYEALQKKWSENTFNIYDLKCFFSEDNFKKWQKKAENKAVFFKEMLLYDELVVLCCR